MVTLRSRINSVKEWMRIIVKVGGGYRSLWAAHCSVRRRSTRTIGLVLHKCFMILVGFDRLSGVRCQLEAFNHELPSVLPMHHVTCTDPD